MKIKNKTPIIAIAVTLAFVAAFALMSRSVILAFCEALFGPSQIDEDERYVYFDDGSVLERTGGPTYTHTLFDGYLLKRSDSRFECVFADGEDWISDFGCVLRYAYDPSGYIAYRFLGISSGEALYVWENYTITSDRTVLYNCSTGSESYFENENELIAYCAENGVELGEWYYPIGYSSKPQETVFESDGWALKSNLRDYCVVSNDGQELFSGEVDRYFCYGGYFGFHLQFARYGDYSVAQNTVITYSEDNVVGKKRHGLLLADVYADCYVLVNTQTDEYDILDNKKVIENRADELNLNVRWEKIE